jgi:asparagine N-glycosylation enzyme membrane subunit Stt3
VKVDRRLAQAIAYKRIATGMAALVGGVVMIGLGLTHGGTTPLIVLAVAIFFGGGAWALRDGVRLHRELRGPR